MNRNRIIRWICTVLVLATVFSLAIPFAGATLGGYYSDIDDATEVGKAVNYLYEHDIMKEPFQTCLTSGMPSLRLRPNSFYPNRAVSKLELIMALWNMLGNPESSSCSIKISDRFERTTNLMKNTYRNAIRWAVSNGILDPATNGWYFPDKALTVEETLTILYRFLNYCRYDTSFPRKAFIPGTPSSTESSKALRWAIHRKLINGSTDFTVDCSRGAVAVFIYKIYEIYQKKYALSVTTTNGIDLGDKMASGMAKAFESAGATSISKVDIFYDVPEDCEEDSFVKSMEEAFSKAKPLDICYFYCMGHGYYDEIMLFRFNNYALCNIYELTPTLLRKELEKYEGTFVVMIESCHSGSFINKSASKAASAEQPFDAEAFVQGFSEAAPTGGQENGSILGKTKDRMKVLCSATQDEPSIIYHGGQYWSRGCGYDIWCLEELKQRRIPADASGDRRVSLQELYEYCCNEVSDEEHPVCYPENDDFIIFERRYEEFG